MQATTTHYTPIRANKNKFEGIENELEDTKTREVEAIQKLKSAEEHLQEKETLHETHTRDSEIKIQEAVANFTSRDTEANSLLEKSRNLEDQLKAYEVQLAESAGKSALLKEELDQLLLVKTNKESENEELHII
ncbi:hypothetical protein L6452_06138 [Arctium lappa]|uniref:Uncharacterized protein n=1 Tax=Arctium lappa TaxID=4217 RepID=A0ACB9EIN1_ARCLA|nr:hypothetical protein L6452_06138 [Arctium lappa]